MSCTWYIVVWLILTPLVWQGESQGYAKTSYHGWNFEQTGNPFWIDCTMIRSQSFVVARMKLTLCWSGWVSSLDRLHIDLPQKSWLARVKLGLCRLGWVSKLDRLSEDLCPKFCLCQGESVTMLLNKVGYPFWIGCTVKIHPKVLT